jgi:hypothetical protein
MDLLVGRRESHSVPPRVRQFQCRVEIRNWLLAFSAAAQEVAELLLDEPQQSFAVSE